MSSKSNGILVGYHVLQPLQGRDYNIRFVSHIWAFCGHSSELDMYICVVYVQV